MELAIIILNWNAADDTIKCVNKILAWQRLHPAVFVVDNASHDDSVERITRECADIQLICNQENLGFTGGTNKGIAAALSQGNAPVLLLNNDAFIGEDDVNRLLQTLDEYPEIGFIGPLLFDADDKDKLLAAGGKNPIRHHHTRISNVEPGETVRTVEYVSGTAIVIKPEIFESVGFLDEDYFFSTELADLCMRAHQHGYLSAIDTRARAYHTVSRSSGLRSTLYVYYIIRNRFIFIRNSPYRFKFFYTLFWTLYSVVLYLKLFISGQKATAQAVQMGLADGLQRRFGDQNERVLSRCRKLTTFTGLYS